MNRKQRIEEELAVAMDLIHLEVLDESHGHNVPPGAESHFKVVAVSESFCGLSRIEKHRRVNGVLSKEFERGLHALSIHAYSPEDWTKRQAEVPLSPPCAGGEAEGRA